MRATHDGIKYEVQWLYEKSFPRKMSDRITILGHDPVNGTIQFKVKNFIDTLCQVSRLDPLPFDETPDQEVDPPQKYDRVPLAWGRTNQHPGNSKFEPDVYVAKHGRRRSLGRALDASYLSAETKAAILDRYLCGRPDFLAAVLAKEEAKEQAYLEKCASLVNARITDILST